MNLQTLIGRCGLEPVWLPDRVPDVTCGYASDLLSDVMAHCPDGAILITVQNHTNTVAVCTLAEVVAILVAHHRDIPDDMLAAARREGIALLRTRHDQFTASCAIGAALHPDAPPIRKECPDMNARALALVVLLSPLLLRAQTPEVRADRDATCTGTLRVTDKAMVHGPGMGHGVSPKIDQALDGGWLRKAAAR
ncbi:MAG: hypothetical protein RBT78_10330 [Kiritimatiellia bacterium]|jgi:hypothetical protein|nr:hypothetical protein [Kiritimatiellia bacterium]